MTAAQQLAHASDVHPRDKVMIDGKLCTVAKVQRMAPSQGGHIRWYMERDGRPSDTFTTVTPDQEFVVKPGGWRPRPLGMVPFELARQLATATGRL